MNSYRHGAEVVDPSNPMPGRVPSSFSGTGYRLGQSSNDTEGKFKFMTIDGQIGSVF